MIVGALSIDAVTVIMPSVLFVEMVFMFGVIAYEYIEIQDDKKQVEFALLKSRQKALTNLLSGQELERERLAKELHDSVGSMLAVVKLKLGKLKNGSAAAIHEFGQLIENISSEVRQISHDLMPTALMMDNLNDALQSLCRQYDEKEDSNVVYYGFDLDRPLSEKLKIEVYRIVQQLLKNAHAHAQATQVLVQVVIDKNCLYLTVEDDGIGFDPMKIKKGIGLNSINNRVAVLKGNIKIESKENEGSSFQIELSLEELR